MPRLALDPLHYRTTNLDPSGDEFPWGPIQHVHEVGRYQIVEYLRDNSRLTVADDQVDDATVAHGQPRFAAYVDGRRTTRSWTTLERALLGAVDYAHNGLNSRGAIFCANALQLP